MYPAKSDADLLIMNEQDHHKIFKGFPVSTGEVPAGFSFDFVGTLIDEKFCFERGVASKSLVTASLPPLDEEYFEWISVLDAAKEAKETFTVVELGAGFGRWAARAVLAARKCGISETNAILVEAEPQHALWAREHMATNNIDRFTIHEAMISSKPGRELFIIRQPEQNGNQAREWYGQAANWTSEDIHRPTNETYCGHQVIDNGSGWGGIQVDVITLSDAIGSAKRVDLLDIDIQGAEGEVIGANIDLLNSCVSTMFVGTHNHEVEESLRSIMTNAGWKCVWDFPCLSKTVTPYGTVDFNDGVQTWKNPRYRSRWRSLLRRFAG